MSPPRVGRFAYLGGLTSSVFLAACCLGLLTLFGLTSFIVTLGVWELNLVSDAVLFTLLGVSLLVTLAGYFVGRLAHRGT